MKVWKKVLFLILLAIIVRGFPRFLILFERQLPKEIFSLVNTVAQFFLYTVVIYLSVYWGYSLYRIGYAKIRKILTTEIILLLLWLFMRALRFSPYVSDNSTFGVYLWYGYYFAMILVPVLNLICALLLGIHENQSSLRFSVPLLSAGIFLVITVLTNNFHQMVFNFNSEFINSEFGKYTHSPLYYVILAFILICELLFLLIVEIKALSAGKRSYLPFAVLGVAVLYALFYIRFDSFILFKVIDLTLAFIFFHIILWESIFTTGLIPTNRDYVKMFSLSTIYAKIVDKNGKLIYQSDATPPKDLKGFLEKSSEISGGYVEYYYDNRELYSLLEKLQNLKTELSEAVNILDEEIKIKKKREKLLLQDELYNTINKNNSFANDKIHSLLKIAEEGDFALKEEALRKILLWGVYIKRYTNLYFIKENKEGPVLSDLSISFDEVLTYFKLNGIDASFDITHKDVWENAPTDMLLKVFFDFFEQFSSRDNIIAISLLLAEKDGLPVYRINTEEAAL